MSTEQALLNLQKDVAFIKRYIVKEIIKVKPRDKKAEKNNATAAQLKSKKEIQKHIYVKRRK